MNTNNVISLPAAVDLTGKEHSVVKLTATGVDLAASTDSAIVIGTLQRANPKQEDGVNLGKSVAVFRRYTGIHFAIIGASTAVVAQGAALGLDAANPGRLIPGGTTIAVAADGFTAAPGAIVNVIFV